jgi:hypothetical protein
MGPWTSEQLNVEHIAEVRIRPTVRSSKRAFANGRSVHFEVAPKLSRIGNELVVGSRTRGPGRPWPPGLSRARRPARARNSAGERLPRIAGSPTTTEDQGNVMVHVGCDVARTEPSLKGWVLPPVDGSGS